MKSIMNHNFSQIPAPQIERSTFNRSCGLKTTFNSGDLVPIFLDEILPGDTLKFHATLLARLSTFVLPIMDNIFLDTFFFFVPTRLLWKNWEKFNGAQDNPGDSIDFTIPKLSHDGGGTYMSTSIGSLADYLGLPTNVPLSPDDYPSALPFRAYNLIYNTWFKDQNLQINAPFNVNDGPDPYTATYQSGTGDAPKGIYKRGKRHDYFTSCLPWPQKGPSVPLPLGTSAPVVGDGSAIGLWDGTGTGYLNYNNDTGFNALLQITTGTGAIGGVPTGTAPSGDKRLGLHSLGTDSHIYADLSKATASNINQLREAFMYQKILERDARGGTRYVELLKSHFGVTSPDFRLNRPEYLGGSSQRINVSAVQSTSSTNTAIATQAPQATLAAYVVGNANARWNKSFVEHGYVIGLANVRADITYQNGLHKLWSRKTRFDFYLPSLAHLGEQAVMQNEIYYEGPTGSTPFNPVFGYQERWAEYRYKPSYVTGRMRSVGSGGTSGESVDNWHLALNFNLTPPLLNSTFIKDQPPINRVLAVTSGVFDQIICDGYFALQHTRPLPVYSVPGGLDRL